LKEQNINVGLRHIAASGALLNIPNSHYDMVRPGILIYGCYSDKKTLTEMELKIQPLLSWKTNVTFVKEMFEGQCIGYGAEHKISKHTKVATIEVGYGDGYSRALYHNGEVLIGGCRYPIVGRISMDQTMIDIGLQSNIKPGDEVVLLGKQKDEEITVNELAEKLNMITYEIVTAISARVERRYIYNGKQLYDFVFMNFKMLAHDILR